MVEITYKGIHYFVMAEHMSQINFDRPGAEIKLMHMAQYAVDGNRNSLLKSRSTVVEMVRRAAQAHIPQQRFSEFDRGRIDT